MKFEHTIDTVHKHLISAFAQIDSWLDHLIDQPDDTDVVELLQHLVISNHSLLQCYGMLDNTSGISSKSNEVFLRTSLRDHLHLCLILLDEVENSS